MSINWTEEEWQEFREGFYERDQTQSTEGTRSEPPVTECDHLVGSHQYEGPIEASWIQRDPEQYAGIPKFTYCPKCGEKL